MKFTAIFAFFFLLPIVYGNFWDDYRKKADDVAKKYMKNIQLPDFQKYVERFNKGQEYWSDAVKENMEYVNGKKEDFSNKMGEHWENVRGTYTEQMEGNKKKFMENKEYFKEKLDEMLGQLQMNSDAYVKIGQQGLDYIKEKFEDYSEKESLEERLEEFQNMFNELMSKANVTFQEFLDQAKDRLEDAELKTRLENLSTVRDEFMKQVQEKAELAREFIKTNLSTPEDRKAFFENLGKMLEAYQEQLEEVIERITGDSGEMYNAFMEKIEEELKKREIEIPTEYRENMDKIKTKLTGMMEKLFSKLEKYMQKKEEKEDDKKVHERKWFKKNSHKRRPFFGKRSGEGQ